MLLLVDLDGVVYRGAEPVPGVAGVLADRARRGDDVVYVTNNSMWYRADYVTRLAGMGAPVSADRVVSSSRATALYLREHLPDVRRVLTVGARGLERELEDVGLDVVTAAAASAARRARPPRRLRGGRPAGCGRRRRRPRHQLRPSRRRGRLHPRRRPVHRHEPRSGLSHRDPPAPRRRFDRCRDRDGGRPRAGDLDRQARAAAPPRGGERRGRERGRRRDDRRRDRHGSRGRPSGRRALRPDAHRRDDPGRARRPARDQRPTAVAADATELAAALDRLSGAGNAA